MQFHYHVEAIVLKSDYDVQDYDDHRDFDVKKVVGVLYCDVADNGEADGYRKACMYDRSINFSSSDAVVRID